MLYTAASCFTPESTETLISGTRNKKNKKLFVSSRKYSKFATQKLRRTTNTPKLRFNNLINNKIMAYVISDDCISCGTCESECPMGAISEGAEHYEINPDECTECGTCASVCPSEAIHLP